MKSLIPERQTAPHPILIIDEEEDVLYFLGRVLENFKSVQLHAAVHPLLAIHLAAEIKPQLVITEIYFPETAAFDAAYLLRRIREPSPEVKVIVTSTISDEAIIKKALRELGAQAYFRKPYSLELLVKKALELLGEDCGVR